MDYKNIDIKITQWLDILSEPIKIINPQISFVDESFEHTWNKYDSEMEFTASMNLLGNLYFTITLGLNRSALIYVADKIFGMDIVALGDEEMYGEGAKEFLNIIAGNSKNKLLETGFEFELSLPEQINWKSMSPGDSSQIGCRSFCFENNVINLIIEVWQAN